MSTPPTAMTMNDAPILLMRAAKAEMAGWFDPAGAPAVHAPGRTA